jgi:tetratricopeptide (TPR) repeat protein
MVDANSKWNFEKILVLSKEGATRASIAKMLKNVGFEVSFVSAVTEVIPAINKFGSGIFIHDYESVDKSQGDLLQQRLSRLDELAPIVRVIYAMEITPKLMAVASDTQVRRLVPYSTNLESLGRELKMVSSTESSVGEMQRKIKEISKKSGKHSQEEADKVIEETYQRFRHDNTIKIEFGGVLIRRDKIDDAKVMGEQILSKEPNNLRAMSLVSRALMKQGKLDEAIKVMENANSLAPGNTERLMSLGEAFYKTNQTEKSKAAYSQAKSADPAVTGEANKALGQIALDQGDLVAASDLLGNSCSEDEAAGFFNNAAVQATRSGKPEHALSLYETALKALKTDRLKSAVYYNIALTQCDLKNNKEALKAIGQALKLDPDFEKAVKLREKIKKENSDDPSRVKKSS